jgi:dTDP-4-dehydrorhamnose reductase
LWERTAPDGLEHADWTFADAWLQRLRALNIRPIVGFVHHGSGPRNTSLLDPEFPNKLACYARAVAERYAWVEDYTPVNEPLTTARFSGMYGWWYPHHRDHLSFLRALLNQCRAIVLSMREIRKINPEARLVQTDDLGKVFASPRLKYQADFENERRWLGWDLVCGRVDRQHSLWSFMLATGVSEAELRWFQEHACPPDMIGVNHYLSSERFLDDNIALYPPESHGTNNTDVYADVLAARVRPEGPAGPKALLREAWERYRIPLAVTEVHNGCTREEQLRWLLEVWDSACELRTENVDLRAVTLWSLLGAHDWDSLVTRNHNHYEPGVFDIRSPQLRPTAIAKLAKELAADRKPDHPLLQVPGWWKRPQRLIYHTRPNSIPELFGDVPPLLITGGRGTLGRAFERACIARGIPHRLLVRSELDIADRDNVQAVLAAFRPWAIINAAGYVRVDDAEQDSAACFRDNAMGPANLAAACAEQGIRLATFSSDLVFDGTKGAPYVESDPPAPLNVYGKSKAEGEQRALALLPTALVVRTSAFFGPWDDHNFVTMALRSLTAGQSFRAAADYLVSPTYVPDLVDATLDLLIDGEYGIWHVANAGATSWVDFAAASARKAGVPESLIEAVTLDELELRAPRPSYSVLHSEKAWTMPALENALDRYIIAAEGKWQAASEPAASLG